MKEILSRRQLFGVALAGVALTCTLSLNAQVQPVSRRILEPVRETSLVTLSGTVQPLANATNDLGPAAEDTRVDRIQLLLKRSPQQESTLQQLIEQMHAPGSAQYHKWLTPAQFGQQFGPAEEDIQAIESWVRAHGFEVGPLRPGKGVLEISGTVGQVQDTFHISIHKYLGPVNTIRANSVASENQARRGGGRRLW